MAQSNKERRIVIIVIVVNAVVSVLLIMSVAYLFTQVSHLQVKNENLRHKWQELRSKRQNDEGDALDGNDRMCCGVKGRRGKAGLKGDPGEAGRDGHIGRPGEDGEPGKNGKKGDKGSAGNPGVKGDQGVCGSCGKNLVSNFKDSPLLHLVGNGKQNKKMSNSESIAVSFWKKKSKVGDIAYSKGKLTINVEGYYYIYSQMAYCENKEPVRVGHYMLINGYTKVLQTTVTTSNHTTHSVGGVFKLNKGDRITVRPTVTNRVYCFSPEQAYFGAFLVHK